MARFKNTAFVIAINTLNNNLEFILNEKFTLNRIQNIFNKDAKFLTLEESITIFTIKANFTSFPINIIEDAVTNYIEFTLNEIHLWKHTSPTNLTERQRKILSNFI